MIWSFSAHRSFQKCPRQWFYKKVFANRRAKEPARREAYRLSKLDGVAAWRGKIVDAVISETIIPSIRRAHARGLDGAIAKADQMFEAQRRQRLARDEESPFFEIEYGLPLTEDMFDLARHDIHVSLEHFFGAAPLWDLLRGAERLVPQRTLSFREGRASVRVVPDLITFRRSEPPTVLDWKVNIHPVRDYWLQLVTGAIGITRCSPHVDWPQNDQRHSANEVQLLEVQLLVGDVRIHSASEADISEAEDFISISAAGMEIALGGSDPKSLRPEDFPVAFDPKVCQVCPFKKLCWEFWT